LAKAVAREAFGRQVLVETAGADDQVVKLLPPLTITEPELAHAFAVLADALDAARSLHEVTGADAAPELVPA
jgi:diaminobutyrate-2-oxoglutarate transaminase